MININDVDCKFLIDSQHGLLELTRHVKENWNGMDKEDRGEFWTTYPDKIRLNARSILEYIYDELENHCYYDDTNDELYERLWENTPGDFVARLQEMLDEIVECNGAIIFRGREKIDPRIDLKEV